MRVIGRKPLCFGIIPAVLKTHARLVAGVCSAEAGQGRSGQACAHALPQGQGAGRALGACLRRHVTAGRPLCSRGPAPSLPDSFWQRIRFHGLVNLHAEPVQADKVCRSRWLALPPEATRLPAPSVRAAGALLLQSRRRAPAVLHPQGVQSRSGLPAELHECLTPMSSQIRGRALQSLT